MITKSFQLSIHPYLSKFLKDSQHKMRICIWHYVNLMTMTIITYQLWLKLIWFIFLINFNFKIFFFSKLHSQHRAQHDPEIQMWIEIKCQIPDQLSHLGAPINFNFQLIFNMNFIEHTQIHTHIHIVQHKGNNFRKD